MPDVGFFFKTATGNGCPVALREKLPCFCRGLRVWCRILNPECFILALLFDRPGWRSIAVSRVQNGRPFLNIFFRQSGFSMVVQAGFVTPLGLCFFLNPGFMAIALFFSVARTPPWLDLWPEESGGVCTFFWGVGRKRGLGGPRGVGGADGGGEGGRVRRKKGFTINRDRRLEIALFLLRHLLVCGVLNQQNT